TVWSGERALHHLYAGVFDSDVPFAQDCVGDQFLFRDGLVWRLRAETGELEELDLSLDGFFKEAEDDPAGLLGLEPLLQFETEGGSLQPGQLLSVVPPFCTAESAEGVSLRSVPVADRLAFLADLAAQLRSLRDVTQIAFQPNDRGGDAP